MSVDVVGDQIEQGVGGDDDIVVPPEAGEQRDLEATWLGVIAGRVARALGEGEGGGERLGCVGQRR